MRFSLGYVCFSLYYTSLGIFSTMMNKEELCNARRSHNVIINDISLSKYILARSTKLKIWKAKIGNYWRDKRDDSRLESW